MKVVERRQGSILRLVPKDRALVRSPNLDNVRALGRADCPLVALDLAGVEFISSLFLQGCVELGRDLANAGRALVLLHLSAHHKRLLAVVDGAKRLAVVDDDDELNARLLALESGLAASRENGGVGSTEKRMLWS